MLSKEGQTRGGGGAEGGSTYGVSGVHTYRQDDRSGDGNSSTVVDATGSREELDGDEVGSGEEAESLFEEDDAREDSEDTQRRSRRLAFSVTVHLPPTGRLGIGISELSDGSVSVTRLDKEAGGAPGCAEAAGLCVNDSLVGKALCTRVQTC